MRAEATAFGPGHITGFFQIVDDATDPAQIGSRGAGFSVDKGVTSRIQIDDHGVPGVTVMMGGERADAATTRRAIELLAGTSDLHVTVDQRVELAVSQGFGMSAAGALSATLALAELLGRPRREAVWAAHSAEVFERTGLGDVVGADKGGFEARERPGCPPYAEIKSWRPEAPLRDVVLAVVSDAVSTKRVLADPRRRKEINAVGGRLMDEFLEDVSLSRFVEASRAFAVEARLATPEIEALWNVLGPDVRGGQCQLGGSVFLLSPSPEARRRLQRAGSVETVGIDWQGARVTSARKVLA